MNKRIRKKKAKQQLIRAISGLVEAAEEMQREQERYLYFGCLVILYFSEKNGRTPRSCKIHFPPSMTAISSSVISCFPNF